LQHKKIMEEQTGIEKIVNGKLSNGNYVEGWYTLDGRALSGQPTQPGIYITNGKKFIIQ